MSKKENQPEVVKKAEPNKGALEKISKAKANLILEQPFFATILCNLPFEEDNRYPTMATNGKWVKYNSKFVGESKSEGLTVEEVKFVLCHEVGHCIFQHMFRLGDRNLRGWNIAGDYVINDLLVKENIGKMPSGDAQGLHDPQLVINGGGTTDGVYDLLPKEMKQDGKNGYQGTGIDICEPADGSEADQAASQAEMKVMVAQAAQAAKMCGKMSANIERFIDGLLQPKVDWKDVLRRFVSARAKIDYSFARPKRRFIADDIYLPSLSGESLGPLVIAVDCSGSIGQQELNEFATEIKAIKEDCRPQELHVVYFDSEVCHYDKFEQDEEVKIAPHGGGGTAFLPIFKYVSDKGIEAVGCVVLTDLCCSDFGPPPGYPVLWVSTCQGTAPWGEVVLMNAKM